ncbi:MAG: hypothetical protein CMH64_02825, partial [Nanoarchaeota archaeon]|nr:hypothetical protein [Nanoarchaeota archaeon]
MADEKELGIKKDYSSSMDSKYQFSMEASRIGATTSPQVANQIGELNSRLNQGLKAVELGTMNQRLLDQVPKEHFTEIHRMAKLTGAEPSLHAPIQDLDLAGFSQQGWDPHEQQRKIKQLEGVMDKAHLLDPKGSTPIVVHAGSFPAMKWEKEGLKELDEDRKIKDVTDRKSEMMLINQQTGEVRPTRYTTSQRIGRDEPEPHTVEDQMEMMNR